MSRSEIRRKKREEEKKKKTYVMTADEIEKIRKQEWERAKKIHEQEMNEISDNIFLMMLSIPVNVLVSDYWQKSAKKRIPEFVESCLSLYGSWVKGTVNMEDMLKLTEEYSGMKFVRNGDVLEKVVNEIH